MTIRTILCDIDGVLIWHHPYDPSKDWRKELEDKEILELWEMFQHSSTWQSCLRNSLMDTRDCFRDFLAARDIDPSRAQNAVDIWLEHNTAPCEPALQRLGQWQKDGLECAIASNQDGLRKPCIENWLDAHGLGELPRFISCDLQAAKPDAVYFFYIEKALGRKPSELMLIDDNKENIDAALEAGWEAFHIDESYRLSPSKWSGISF